jgi:acyl dehydratase
MSRELTVGASLEPTEYVAELWPMKVFTLVMADPNPIHFDPAFVASIGRGDRTINQGTLNIAYPLNALMAWLGGDEASARIARFTCRFAASVYEGDVVVAGGQVTEVAENGDATVDLWLDRKDGERALSGSVLVRAAR